MQGGGCYDRRTLWKGWLKMGRKNDILDIYTKDDIEMMCNNLWNI
mgnify:CR=1 FL=1